MTMTVDGFIIGKCLVGTVVGFTDFSRFERDEFGNLTIIERQYTDNITYQVQIETIRSDEIRNFLASLRATLAIYIGTEKFSITQVSGYLDDFTISMDDDYYSTITITVESELHA